MLLNVGLLKEFWVEVVNLACYLINRSLFVELLKMYGLVLLLSMQI